ncbi:DUF5133 domain-containing protein [Streptomyces sp. NPDC051704]|uniref:DUF5133 domain-containing protein n=1 Tax=Streptomyces sp. NPDC051704 TaxID=3365671 RepID=UPI0037A0F381
MTSAACPATTVRSGRCARRSNAPAPHRPRPPQRRCSPFVLRQQVSQVRVARLRTSAAPHDPVQRAELENCLYALCVLTGRRSAYATLTADEAFLGGGPAS